MELRKKTSLLVFAFFLITCFTCAVIAQKQVALEAHIFSTDGVDLLASPGATRNSASHTEGREIRLVLNARKNGYTVTVEGRKVYFQGHGVEDPFTNEPLEGIRTLSYGCETPSNIESREVPWTKGRTARILMACALIHEPKVLILDEPSPN